MNASGVQGLFTPELLQALWPALILSSGAVLLLLASALDLSRAAHAALVAAALSGAAVQLVRQLAGGAEPGLLLQGTFAADRGTALWGLVFVAGTAVAWLSSLGYYRAERPFQNEHDALFLCAAVGMILMAGARNLIVFFVGLELLSIPLYALAAFRRDRPASVEAGLKYFLLGAFAAAFFLYGSGLFYQATGTVTLGEVPEGALESPLALAGVALLAASVFFKLGVFPFHVWIPDVYQGAPTPVTALMATGTKTAAFAFLVGAADLLPEGSATTVAWIALATMAIGNLGALAQDDVKRMLAYSGIAHAGTLLLAVAGKLAGDPDPDGALRAGLFYLAAYVFTAGGAFGLLALLEREGEHFTRLESLRGLARRRPFVAAALTLFMLSLGGIPLTGGFMGKWLVFGVTVRADMIAITVAGVLLSVVALAYYLRVVVAMYMQEEPEGLARDERVSRPGSAPAALAAAICAALVLATGVWPGWLLDQIR